MYGTTDTLKHIHTQITQADINALTFSLTFLFSCTQTRTCTNFPSPPNLSDSPCRPSFALLRCCQSCSPLPLLLKLTCYSQRFLRAFSSSSRPRQCPPRQTHRCRCYGPRHAASSCALHFARTQSPTSAPFATLSPETGWPEISAAVSHLLFPHTAGIASARLRLRACTHPCLSARAPAYIRKFVSARVEREVEGAKRCEMSMCNCACE